MQPFLCFLFENMCMHCGRKAWRPVLTHHSPGTSTSVCVCVFERQHWILRDIHVNAHVSWGQQSISWHAHPLGVLPGRFICLCCVAFSLLGRPKATESVDVFISPGCLSGHTHNIAATEQQQSGHSVLFIAAIYIWISANSVLVISQFHSNWRFKFSVIGSETFRGPKANLNFL